MQHPSPEILYITCTYIQEESISFVVVRPTGRIIERVSRVGPTCPVERMRTTTLAGFVVVYAWGWASIDPWLLCCSVALCCCARFVGKTQVRLLQYALYVDSPAGKAENLDRENSKVWVLVQYVYW